MPSYTFRNKKTGKTTEKFMSISEADAYELEFPDWERMCGAPGISYRGTKTKPDDGFRDRLREIKKKHRRAKINTF